MSKSQSELASTIDISCLPPELRGSLGELVSALSEGVKSERTTEAFQSSKQDQSLLESQPERLSSVDISCLTPELRDALGELVSAFRQGVKSERTPEAFQGAETAVLGAILNFQAAIKKEFDKRRKSAKRQTESVD